MLLLMLGLVVAAHGWEEPGWTTRHERRQWLLVRVKEKERRKEKRKNHSSRMANKQQFQIFMMVTMLTANGMETANPTTDVATGKRSNKRSTSSNRSNTGLHQSLGINNTRS